MSAHALIEGGGEDREEELTRCTKNLKSGVEIQQATLGTVWTPIQKAKRAK